MMKTPTTIFRLTLLCPVLLMSSLAIPGSINRAQRIPPASLRSTGHTTYTSTVRPGTMPGPGRRPMKPGEASERVNTVVFASGDESV